MLICSRGGHRMFFFCVFWSVTPERSFFSASRWNKSEYICGRIIAIAQRIQFIANGADARLIAWMQMAHIQVIVASVCPWCGWPRLVQVKWWCAHIASRFEANYHIRVSCVLFCIRIYKMNILSHLREHEWVLKSSQISATRNVMATRK